MIGTNLSGLSRRKFMAVAGVSAAAGAMASRNLFGQIPSGSANRDVTEEEGNIVPEGGS